MIKHPKVYEQALHRILDCSRLDVAKEIASDVLEVDLDEYLVKDEDDEQPLDFEDDTVFGFEGNFDDD